MVSLDPDRLQAVGLTAADVSRRLRGSNVDLAEVAREIGGRDEAIRTLGGARTLTELAETMITLPMGGEVRLQDLGIVTDTIADRRTFARLDGEPIVAFGIKRSKGASDVVVAAAVQKRIDELKQANPDVDLKLIDTSVDFTHGNYEAAIHTLFEGAALAVIVVFLFLRDLRATVIAAVSLRCRSFAFWVMDLLGFSLNLVSFLAITLSTRILVDDAIVEIENIVRHMRQGKSPYQAAIEAADEIGLAVIAISLTIIAIFTPASFMSGIAGQFFKQFGITVSVQVFFSLLAARLVTPMLAAYFLKPDVKEEKQAGRVLQAYTRLVTWSVQNRFVTIWSVLRCSRRRSGASSCCRGFLPAQDSAPLARDRAATRIATDRYRTGDRGIRRKAAWQAGGEERLRQRRKIAQQRSGGSPRLAHRQLHAQGRPLDYAARSRARHRARSRWRSRHPLLVRRRERPARHIAGRDRGGRDGRSGRCG